MSTARFPATLPIPEEVLRIAKKLEEAGFETWCVGGAVRDNLLGLENMDFDLATAAKPEDVQRLFSRTVPVGVEHGTVAVLGRGPKPHEVTTFRRDVKTDGRHAVVEFGVSLDDDLARRDFTINAIAHHPLSREWRDPFDGYADLGRGIVRAVGHPGRRFQEDYLRILRALRFAARFGFAIDPKTWEAALANADGLKHLSAERVRDEWFKGLEGAKRPGQLVRLWDEVGALRMWLPEVGEPNDENIDRLAIRDPVLITSHLSADPAATLTRLRCSNAEIERGRRIGAHRGEHPGPESGPALRRWMSVAGSAVDDLVALARAAEPRYGERLGGAVKEARAARAPLTLGDLAITGDDLKAAGLPQGREMGVILRRLLDLVLEDPSGNTRAALLEAARKMEAERER